jgi:hypothetical protein
MAYKVTTIPLWKKTAIGSGSAGGTSLSAPIDLREINRQGAFSLSYAIAAAGAAATAATCMFHYVLSSTVDGTYISPINGDGGTIGTAGTGIVAGEVRSFTPVVMPFMKVKVIAGTSGTALVTAELNVR